ncbi:MAG: hypothetical protein F4Y26_16710 [Gammaproteobacteria bacterium]|nr:hypothetical protein [Gammaproteobacteria bacterium]
MNLDTLQSELAAFADLGTDPPEICQHDTTLSAKLHRNGELLRLVFEDDGDGKVEVRRGTQRQMRPNYRTLLASEIFGDLNRWIANQQRLLKPTRTENAISLEGTLSTGDSVDVKGFDEFLSRSRKPDMVRAVLIDGPAGIGKTKFIERLALERAEGFRRTRRPLILHVQSRGRVLTYLQDLIATSLQILRLSVTFDQVPILARHGLVTIAIDGFDELGDPNGYDLAWNQVNELVRQIRGDGTLILAGRDTFIGRERVESDIQGLLPGDEIDALALQPPSPAVAKRYLEKEKGWPKGDDFAELLDVLLEPNSYALRPFFLSRLDADTVQPMLRHAGGNPLAYLVDTMVEREATKFGDAVETAMTVQDRESFVRGLLREAARTMADDQSEAVEETVLAWMAEFVGDNFTGDEEVLRILKNRAIALAFLENDDDPRYRRFPSSQIANHFLAEETVERISEGEIPKYVRRNIMGADFLRAFSDLTMHVSTRTDDVQAFFREGVEVARSNVGSDRTSRNVGGLLLATLPALGGDELWSLEGLSIDEALIEETPGTASLRDVVVNQLDLRGANVGELCFENCSVHTLIVDDLTQVSESLPIPAMLRRENTASPVTVTDPAVIQEWLGGHGKLDGESDATEDPIAEFRMHDFVKTLERACRAKAFWIPVAGDDTGSRFAKSAAWPTVMQFLEEQGVGSRSIKGVAGQRNDFFRIRNRGDVLGLLHGSGPKAKVRRFQQALVKAIVEV